VSTNWRRANRASLYTMILYFYVKNHQRNYILTPRLREHCQLHALWITCGEAPHAGGPNTHKSGHNNSASVESQPTLRPLNMETLGYLYYDPARIQATVPVTLDVIALRIFLNFHPVFMTPGSKYARRTTYLLHTE